MAIANEISGIEDCVYSLTNKANIIKLSINDNTMHFILNMLFHGAPFFVTVWLKRYNKM